MSQANMTGTRIDQNTADFREGKLEILLQQCDKSKNKPTAEGPCCSGDRNS